MQQTRLNLLYCNWRTSHLRSGWNIHKQHTRNRNCERCCRAHCNFVSEGDECVIIAVDTAICKLSITLIGKTSRSGRYGSWKRFEFSEQANVASRLERFSFEISTVSGCNFNVAQKRRNKKISKKNQQRFNLHYLYIMYSVQFSLEAFLVIVRSKFTFLVEVWLFFVLSQETSSEIEGVPYNSRRNVVNARQ